MNRTNFGHSSQSANGADVKTVSRKPTSMRTMNIAQKNASKPATTKQLHYDAPTLGEAMPSKNCVVTGRPHVWRVFQSGQGGPPKEMCANCLKDKPLPDALPMETRNQCGYLGDGVTTITRCTQLATHRNSTVARCELHGGHHEYTERWNGEQWISLVPEPHVPTVVVDPNYTGPRCLDCGIPVEEYVLACDTCIPLRVPND